VLAAAIAGALAGAQTGFWLGRRGGRALLARTRGRWLPKGADRAGELLDRYGYARAIVLARFIPVVRTILNPLAGMLNVPVRTFTLWQVAGGIVWAAGVTLAGYALGASIPGIDQYLLPAIAVVVVASAIPVAIEFARVRRGQPRRQAATGAPPPTPRGGL
jgi:membrane-associated protein